MISLITCMDKNRGIGKNNSMPWHLPKELSYFKEKTENSVVVMGRKTYESIGKSLPNRINIVISSTRNISNDNTLTFTSVNDFINFLNTYKLVDIETGEELDVYIIGGATIYEQFLPYADRLYVTRIISDFGCDAFFPDLCVDDWHIVNYLLDEDGDFELEYMIYDRQKK